MSKVYFGFTCHFDFPGSTAHQTPKTKEVITGFCLMVEFHTQAHL